MPRFATIRKNEGGVVLEVDEATTQILGRAAEDLIGGRTLAFTHPDDHALVIENWMEMLATPGPARRVRVRYQRGDQSWVWFEVTNHNLLNDPGQRCVVSGMLDISEEMAAGEALRAREQLLDRLAEAIPLGLFQIDSARHIVYTNDRLHEIIGVARSPTVTTQVSTVIDEDRPALETAPPKPGEHSHRDDAPRPNAHARVSAVQCRTEALVRLARPKSMSAPVLCPVVAVPVVLQTRHGVGVGLGQCHKGCAPMPRTSKSSDAVEEGNDEIRHSVAASAASFGRNPVNGEPHEFEVGVEVDMSGALLLMPSQRAMVDVSIPALPTTRPVTCPGRT
jgi:PAS domain S-box-containing protein